jgi:hypothetical protein
MVLRIRTNPWFNEKTPYNGFVYDLKAEAQYAMYLDTLKRRGKLLAWDTQVHMPLNMNENGCAIISLMWSRLANRAAQVAQQSVTSGVGA